VSPTSNELTPTGCPTAKVALRRYLGGIHGWLRHHADKRKVRRCTDARASSFRRQSFAFQHRRQMPFIRSACSSRQALTDDDSLQTYLPEVTAEVAAMTDVVADPSSVLVI